MKQICIAPHSIAQLYRRVLVLTVLIWYKLVFDLLFVLLGKDTFLIDPFNGQIKNWEISYWCILMLIMYVCHTMVIGLHMIPVNNKFHSYTDNPFYTDTLYNKICYNDNLTIMKPSLKR